MKKPLLKKKWLFYFKEHPVVTMLPARRGKCGHAYFNTGYMLYY